MASSFVYETIFPKHLITLLITIRNAAEQSDRVLISDN